MSKNSHKIVKNVEACWRQTDRQIHPTLSKPGRHPDSRTEKLNLNCHNKTVPADGKEIDLDKILSPNI